MEEEIKEQIREMVLSLEVKENVPAVIYIAKIEAQQVVIQTPEKA